MEPSPPTCHRPTTSGSSARHHGHRLRPPPGVLHRGGDDPTQPGLLVHRQQPARPAARDAQRRDSGRLPCHLEQPMGSQDRWFLWQRRQAGWCPPRLFICPAPRAPRHRLTTTATTNRANPSTEKPSRSSQPSAKMPRAASLTSAPRSSAAPEACPYPSCPPS